MNKNLSKITLSQSNIVKKLKKHKKIHQTVANKILCDYKINVSRIIFGTTDRGQNQPIFSTQVKNKNQKEKNITLFSKQFCRIPPKHKQIWLVTATKAQLPNLLAPLPLQVVQFPGVFELACQL